MELSETILAGNDTSTNVSICIHIMFGPHLGYSPYIRVANWHDGFGLRDGPLGFDYVYTKDIYEKTTYFCRCLMNIGRFSQDDVDCYHSLASNGVFQIDFIPSARNQW